MGIQVQSVLLQNRLPGLLQRLRPQLRLVVLRAAHAVEEHARTSIVSGPKSGRIYHRHNDSHRASAPGESPANELGQLAQGITVVDGRNDLEQKVISTAPYSVDLELGTVNMDPRPFLRPALESVREPMVEAIRGVIENG